MEKIKKYGLLYLSIDDVYQISLKSEMVRWTPLDDLAWNDSKDSGPNGSRHSTNLVCS
jgi:hypothetical protein